MMLVITVLLTLLGMPGVASASRAPTHGPAAAALSGPAPTTTSGVDPSSPEGIRYASRVSNSNMMGVTVTNYGFVGNLFVSRSPSMEYPIGTGHEHLVYGGLWVGARGVDGPGPFTRVTTGCLDLQQGGSSAQATEFTPSGDQIGVRSNLPYSHFYHPDAVSQQDFVSDYDDLTPRRATNNPQDHRPMGLLVRQENYTWNVGRLSHVLFFRFVIKTAGPTLTDVRVGLNTELASGPKSLYASWPPSASSGPGSWYRKAWLQFDGPLALLREHYCAALPVPAGCNLGFVPYWAGLKLLTPPDPALGQAVTLAGWPWNPSEPSRDEDVERYALMAAGTIADLTAPDLVPQTGDPVELLSIGPFSSLAPGDSVVVGFALIGGSDVADIQENARAAQQAWDSGFIDLPTAVQLSLVSVVADPGRVAITWQTSEPGTVCPIERLAPGAEWAGIARITADGTGRITLEDRDVLAGTRYGYRVLAVGEEAPVVLDEVWVEVPGEARFALEGWSPNPSSGARPMVALALASEGQAALELLDVAGRRIHIQSLDGLGPGRHVVRLDTPRSLGSGVYFLRLVQGARTATRRVAVVQ